MGRLAIVRAEHRRPVPARELVDPARVDRFATDVLDASITRYFDGFDDVPVALSEVTFGPDAEVAPHAHTEDEVIVVSAGSMRMGSHDLAAGSAVYIPKETVYGFTAGPDGCTFLNFRPSATVGFLTREEALTRTRARRHGSVVGEAGEVGT